MSDSLEHMDRAGRAGAEQANPYIAGSPVTVGAMFFGREDVFDFIRQAMVGRHRDNVIVLYGQRRTGKTSILYQLQRQLGPRYVCVFIDLHALALDSVGGAMWELASSISRALRREQQIEVARPERAAFLDDPRAQFENEFLGQVFEAIGDRQLVLMLDEVIRLQEQIEAGRLDKEIFSYLRHLMQHHERLSFLFSLGSGLEQMSKEYALLFSVALYKKISFLDRDAAVALVRRPVEGLFEVDEDAIERILEIGCGHPYFTQLICHGMFNRWQRHHTPRVTSADVDAVIDEAVERGLAVLKHVWEESTAGEKAVLAALAAAGRGARDPIGADQIAAIWAERGVVVPQREVSSAAQSLIARDVIVGTDTYAFTVDLQRRWVAQYRRVEWVHEEIATDAAAWSAAAARLAPPASPVVEAAPGRSARRTLFTGAAVAVLALIAFIAWTSMSNMPSPTATPATAVPATPPPAAPALAATAVPTAASAAVLGVAATAAPVAAPTVVVPKGDAALINDLVAGSGVVWAATDGGLVRWTPSGAAQLYDSAHGSGFGFEDDGRESIAIAPDGTLWIGGGGVAHVRVNGDRLNRIQYYDRDDGLGMGAVRTVVVDADGSIWAGGAPDAGKAPPLSHFDGQNRGDGNAWHTLDVPLDRAPLSGASLRIGSILRASDGALWLGLAEAGVLRWDGARWIHFAPTAPLTTDGRCPSDIRVRQLVEDRAGAVWAAGTCQGLLRLDPSTGAAQQTPLAGTQRVVQAMTVSSGGQLWVAGPEFAATSADGGQSWTIVGSTEDGLGADASALIEGPDGRLWLGDYGLGLSVLDGQQWRHLQR